VNANNNIVTGVLVTVGDLARVGKLKYNWQVLDSILSVDSNITAFLLRVKVAV